MSYLYPFTRYFKPFNVPPGAFLPTAPNPAGSLLPQRGCAVPSFRCLFVSFFLSFSLFIYLFSPRIFLLLGKGVREQGQQRSPPSLPLPGDAACSPLHPAVLPAHPHDPPGNTAWFPILGLNPRFWGSSMPRPSWHKAFPQQCGALGNGMAVLI